MARTHKTTSELHYIKSTDLRQPVGGGISKAKNSTTLPKPTSESEDLKKIDPVFFVLC